MAKMTVKGLEDVVSNLGEIGNAGLPAAKMGLYEGAKIVADQLKKNINSLPVDTPRWLKSGDEYSVIVAQDKKDLADSMGIMEFERNEDGVRTVIGFAGYGRHRTKKYSKGLPMVMIARSIESGSSVRRKHPFVRPAVNATRARARAKIVAVTEEELQKAIDRKG